MTKATPHHEAFDLLACTGVRRREACGLMWSDVDLDAATASIRQGAVRVRGQGVVVRPPKAERGERLIALDADTVDMRRAHRGAQVIQQSELG